MMQRTPIYHGRILDLEVLDGRWEVVKHADAVAILAVREREVLGVYQERPAIGGETWEIPAGLIDPGESPLEAARRELAEEANLTGDLSLLSQFYSSPGFSDEKIYLYRASKLEPCAGQLDPGEVLRPAWRDVDELWREIASGRLASSAPSVLALALARGGAA